MRLMLEGPRSGLVDGQQQTPAPVEGRCELLDDPVTYIIGWQTHCRDAVRGEDRQILAPVPEEPLLAAVLLPAIELDGQPMIGEVGIDTHAGFLHVDPGGRQLMLAQQLQED
jgi:hypothetical protein